MKVFNKQDSNQDSAPAVQEATGKRDVTIKADLKRHPDHVVAETDAARWVIPLTNDERFQIAKAYEEAKDAETESLIVENFTRHIYQTTASKFSVEISPISPGKVLLNAAAGDGMGGIAEVVRYEDVGQTINKWVLRYQRRRLDLVADLVAVLGLPDDD
ncbi:MAG: hypothetical protein EPN31_14045 [Castellaniella sp.]|uniref:hypothetical protein n=1 Tax=Castellaniella sp. TaxID=1955812 RepID=UPI001217DDF4|nr:hypothetical protein [Castellaniella sp.]TAN26037.1 MAG: hypothetical protein EPN31_14045 [Castellaniella sp.]